MTTRSQPQQVEGAHVVDVNTRDVAEGLHGLTPLGDNKQRALAGCVATVPHLTTTRSNFPGSINLLHIRVGSNILQQLHSILSLLQGLDGGRNDKRNLWHILQIVSSGHNQGWNGSSSEGRPDCQLLHLPVGPGMPLAVRLGRCKHAPTTAHVPESTLPGTVSTTTRNTRNTCHSTTRTPGFCTRLVPGTAGYRIGDTFVLAHLPMHELNDIISQCRRESFGEGSSFPLLLNGDQRSSSHHGIG
mmetsp:Transcript_64597/g.107037  ORF Transcript_64597/g.107037 Transcript_64597/m.107037 type:complete len:244 (+) Transcript_64597:1039-1770(+)